MADKTLLAANIYVAAVERDLLRSALAAAWLQPGSLDIHRLTVHGAIHKVLIRSSVSLRLVSGANNLTLLFMHARVVSHHAVGLVDVWYTKHDPSSVASMF